MRCSASQSDAFAAMTRARSGARHGGVPVLPDSARGGNTALYRHPEYPLWLHDDDELGELLGSPVTERVVIHEWPLSCVQRVRTAGGVRCIYKAQAPPTVEPDFYARARSELLVPARIAEALDHPPALILEELDAPRLSDLRLEEPALAAIAAELPLRIAAIGGSPPVMADLSTEARWTAYMDLVWEDLRALIGEGGFRRTDLALVDDLARWSESPSVREAFEGQTGLVHADLKAENVLVTPDGCRVLDWQRPILGPSALDTATLLISLGIDPARHVPGGIVQLYHFLHIAWYAQAARRWFPQGKPWFDGLIRSIGEEIAGIRGRA
ncbi:phosphotransferase [Paenibacillus glycinis]|uniref:Phosphotransferase n=1 Tax=Paenibacillus glycinis TaxID=2697035 RepID=A0ABW9XYJ7_9BACL|nr:phosphotransferase [Paenibacillus glycinis]NBD27780.1 phosphotransferase [Paenibacillus glycinis]